MLRSDRTMPFHPTLVHPKSGEPLQAIGIIRGRVRWPILGAAPDGDGAQGGEGAGGESGAGSAGDGQASTYTAPASQADLDRIIEQRLSRERAKFADYDTLKDKATKHDAMQLELGTTAEQAAASARAEERALVQGEWTPRVVTAEFKAAAKGVLTGDQLTALLEDLDLSKYVNDKGDVDEDKVAKKVTAFAPAKNGTTTQTRTLGQGQQQQSTARPGDGARAALAARGIKIAD